MRKIQLIEWGIIAIALVLGYRAFENIFTVIVQLIYGLAGTGYYGEFQLGYLVGPLLVVGLYLSGFLVIIKNSYRIALYISGNTANESLPVNIGKKALLHVILVGISIYTIITGASRVILYLVYTFKKEIGPRLDTINDSDFVSKYNFQVAVGQVIIALIVIYCAKDIVNWFVRKSEPDELVLESKPESDPHVHQ